ncbi:unnamed protein product [Ambrosiozyma monospora]|uniref:Unnamed protein product n=1 Tax=Ambrosiozyma monospora TaxID=43982 RepID=A0ACB5T569_AMBMO|nr:unnamed protein product [Ambrosiozyma monospora]
MWNNLLSKEGKQQLKLSIASTPAGKSTARGRARAPLSTVTNDRLGEDPEAEWRNMVMKNSGLDSHGGNGIDGFNVNQEFGSMSKPKNKVISQLDLGQLLEQQVLALQLRSASPPESIKKVLRSMSPSEKSGMPSIHYIGYLECLQVGDYEGSFKSLHRYFDYMMSSRQQLFSHYALLSLATLHAFFGSDTEALRGIDEAIAVARENKDLDCLNYLLTWLFNFLRDRPNLDSKVRDKVYRDQILQFLKLKTKENKNWLLQAMTYQYEALQEVQLKLVLENLTKSSYILLNLDNTEDSRTSFVKNCQLISSVWYRSGIPALARLYTEIAFEFSKKSLFDRTTTMLRQVILDHDSGHVDKALQFFDSDVTPPTSLWRYLSTRHLLLQSDNWIKRSRLRQAGSIVDRLKVCASELCDLDIYFEIQSRQAIFESRVGNIDASIDVVNETVSKLIQNPYCDYGNNYWTAEFKLLYGEVIFDNLGDPDRGTGDVLDSLKRSKQSCFLPVALKCILNLCERCIDQSSSLIEDPEVLLEYAMTKVLQTDNLWLKAKAFLLLSRAKLVKLKKIASATASTTANEVVETQQQEEVKKQYTDVLEYLEIAVVGFRKLTDFTMMKRCFEVEQSLAEMSGYTELSIHASSSIEQLNKRIHEESMYAASC